MRGGGQSLRISLVPGHQTFHSGPGDNHSQVHQEINSLPFRVCVFLACENTHFELCPALTIF